MRNGGHVSGESNLITTFLEGEAEETSSFGDDQSPFAAGVAGRAGASPLIAGAFQVELEERDGLGKGNLRLYIREVDKGAHGSLLIR
jgi:hypothetical protein